jgi:hypothetical protein
MSTTVNHIKRTKNVDLIIQRFRLNGGDLLSRRKAVRSSLIRRSSNVTQGNFDKLAPKDLRILFEEYDSEFFDGFLQDMLTERDSPPVSFRLSKRMTSAAGATKYRRLPASSGETDAYRPLFELVIAIDLLFRQFKSGDRQVHVNGLECSDRLEALQRVFEHELTHMLELMVWESSSCKKSRFHKMAQHIFGHTEFTHQLITSKERARSEHNIQVGSEVAFEFHGLRYEGVVIRITKRATVLVKSTEGVLYTDGIRYRKYYTPISELHLLGVQTNF